MIVGRAYLPDMGGSSSEGAFSTAQCRASMPDLQTEEFRMMRCLGMARARYQIGMRNRVYNVSRYVSLM
jgi:hypothetical protein